MFKKFGISILILVCIITQSKIIFAEEFFPEETQTEEEIIPEEVQPQETIEETLSDEEIVSEDPQIETIPENTEDENIPEEVPISEETVMVILRVGGNVLFQGNIELPESGTREIADNLGNMHTIDSRSVLSVLNYVDTQEESFSVSKLVYYDSFESFYLQCITVENQGEFCDDWQYAVNTMTPWQSINQLTVQNNDTLGIYFGKPFRLTFPSNQITIGTHLIITAEKYLYETGIWVPRSEVTVGATVPNPENPWEPIIVSEQSVDENGQSAFSFSLSNMYFMGVKEDYYYPLYPLLVTTTQEENESSSNEERNFSEDSFNIDSALAYLKSVQLENGSFADSKMISDWVAVAFGAFGVSGDARDKILGYFIQTNTSSPLVTDNARRAMAILAQGMNPYDFFGVDYITPIVEKFDGRQIGNPSLINDDIFALLVLSHAGYRKGENIINAPIEFILSRQELDGSWENSIDMTAATIQVIKYFDSVSGVSSALDKAKDFLMNKQEISGGWESTYSTSWVAQAMWALNEDWEKSGNSVLDYFINHQEDDGAVIPMNEILENRIWATSYAIPAVLGKTWDSFLATFPKPVIEDISVQSVVDEIEIEKEIIPSLDSVQENNFQNNIILSEFSETFPINQKRNIVISDGLKEEYKDMYEKSESSSLVASANIPTDNKGKMQYVFIILFLLGGVFLHSRGRNLF